MSMSRLLNMNVTRLNSHTNLHPHAIFVCRQSGAPSPSNTVFSSFTEKHHGYNVAPHLRLSPTQGPHRPNHQAIPHSTPSVERILVFLNRRIIWGRRPWEFSQRHGMISPRRSSKKHLIPMINLLLLVEMIQQSSTRCHLFTTPNIKLLIASIVMTEKPLVRGLMERADHGLLVNRARGSKSMCFPV
jgi:hypothetical protein